MNTSIDIITPTYNNGAFIRDCIESVKYSITLDRLNIRHIVVDDGSTDDTAHILRSIRHKHMEVVTLVENGGHAAARNRGLAAAQGNYVFFLDADDILFRNSIRYLWECAENGGYDWVYGDFLRGDKDGTYIPGDDYYGWEFGSPSEVLVSMYTGNHFFQQNSLFERYALDKAGGFDETLDRAVDFDLCTRLLIKGYLPHFLRGPLYMHRYHDANISRDHLQDEGLHKKQVAGLYARHKDELVRILPEQSINKIHAYIT